jgi:hypothetical protein
MTIRTFEYICLLLNLLFGEAFGMGVGLVVILGRVFGNQNQRNCSSSES